MGTVAMPAIVHPAPVKEHYHPPVVRTRLDERIADFKRRNPHLSQASETQIVHAMADRIEEFVRRR